MEQASQFKCPFRTTLIVARKFFQISVLKDAINSLISTYELFIVRAEVTEIDNMAASYGFQSLINS